MKEKAKKILTFLISTFLFFMSNNVMAQPNKITLGPSKQLPEYLANVSFPTKQTTNGSVVYCLDVKKLTAFNVDANLVGELDAGFAYIIEHGYPYKSLTGDSKKDYYITQAAIWWYLDDTQGTENLGTKFKETAQDPNGIRPYVKALVDGAKKHNKYSKPTMNIISNNKLNLSNDKKYYISDDIKVESNNIKEFKVYVKNGVSVIDKNGKDRNQFKNKESFKIKVPVDLVESTNTKFNVEIKATATINKVYKYEPTDKKMQPVVPAILYPTNIEIKENVEFDVNSSKVSIIKLDKLTTKPLSGAELKIEDVYGNTIDKWVSTINTHVIRNLKNGKYKLIETKAPAGYKKINKPIEFEITDSNKEVYIKLNNEPIESVVTITKIDKSKDIPLAGAILVVKNEKGEVVDRFVTTTKPRVIRGLANGTYTVSEEKAPDGFQKVNDVIKFTLNDKFYSYQVDFYNYPIVEVPDTGIDKNMLNTIIGFIITISTVTLLYKYAK